MNFILICLHCLDMRDFHSVMRNTPFLDSLREGSTFIPMGRAQGHHERDSLNAEMTGRWTARFCDSTLTHGGYRPGKRFWYPKTLLEYLREADYEIVPCFRGPAKENMGTAAFRRLKLSWLAHEPERLKLFHEGQPSTIGELLEKLHRAERFYAHVFVRDTHRPWGQPEGLGAIVGQPTPPDWPEDARCARKAALDRPDEFAALRRRGLARADTVVREIVSDTANLDNVTYVIYSNHGEVFDQFRYVLPYRDDGVKMIEGTSHGPYPYEVLYANMQMWIIPGSSPRVMRGVGRSIDIPATILELAGITPEWMDGKSMLPEFRDGWFPARDRYAETGSGNGLSMVRSDGMKLISTGMLLNEAQESSLYGPDHHRLAVFDLNADPREYVNLIETPYGREVLEWAIETHAGLKELPRD